MYAGPSVAKQGTKIREPNKLSRGGKNSTPAAAVGTRAIGERTPTATPTKITPQMKFPSVKSWAD